MTLWLYLGFLAFVFVALALDLGVFNRREHVMSMIEALAWTAMWVSLAIGFCYLVYCIYEYHWLGMGLRPGHALNGQQAALQFFTGYLVEESLSVDNMVVIAVIFGYFRVPRQYQHRVLFWGILGALIMRGAMIAAGTALIDRFDWILYVFGGLLLFTAARLLLTKEEHIDPERNLLVRLTRKLYPVVSEIQGNHFFTRVEGRRALTLLFPVLLVVESSDVLFAVDSIPAVIAVTRDPFLVFTSNVFAILGLRSLYFAFAGMIHQFKYLKTSVVVLLAFVGVKMLIEHYYEISTGTSLGVIVVILAVGVLASLIAARRERVPVESVSVSEAEASSGAISPADLALFAWKQARRIAVLLIGSSLILVGLAMVVLPGPATVVIPLGLAVLSTEFLWAKRILHRLKTEATGILGSLTGSKNKKAANSPSPDDPS